ncbi:chromosome transmission fidelity protein 18 homolog [Anneissia japonica]|uniref:chromosome transmission fidelity protein 18 homolog n=1 Tax=Anneissia japonica TaxID=1529436 RepID=UPI0014255CEB|nr:chromosome transmission fidelity protein 18 homolog [Anneissia japonica]
MEPDDLYDDFEAQFADELDALRDFESDIQYERKEPDLRQNHENIRQSLPAGAKIKTSSLSNFDSNSKKRERELDELFASLSDSEEELVIDEQMHLCNNLQKKAADGEPSRRQPTLWVDKYSPRHYTDLLSDDGVNRNILYWLKLWDTCVFKRERVKREKNQQEKRNQNFKGNFKQNNFKATPEEILSEQKFDEHKRPELKVALLCGPPGLGKTTLAHVIAEHAGYNVIEMNASDDRSQDVFKRKLESATQMQSVLSRDNRPNCMVIDEIDGSPAATINVLIDYVKGPEAGKKKKKKGQSVLLRPIICICNDLYVPALRPLRQIAFVSHFPPTVASRLASRLMQIATNNALKTDMTTLMTLCQKTENDIRSCLNTLQFIQTKGNGLSLSMVSSMNIGQKDKHKGLFTLWKDTFAMPRPQRKRYVNPHDVDKNGVERKVSAEDNVDFNPASPSSRFNNMLQAVLSNGDYDKLLSGIFENYLEVKFKDSHLDAVNHACDWLIFHDVLNKEILHTQSYILMRYLPYVPVVFHMMFASNAANKIHYPSAHFENMQKMAKTTNLLTSLCNEVSPYIKRNLNKEVAIMQVLPPLLTIIQPSFRPVNPQLFNTLEKQQMTSLVSTMIAYNLTYQQERSPEGQYNYVLDPNLEELVRFTGMPPSKQMTYAAKQLIAREIEVEKLRRSEEVKPDAKIKNAEPSKETKIGNKKKPVVPRHLEKLQPKKVVEEEDKPATDFFGRVITKKVQKTEDVPDNEEVMKNSLWYKFNEGFTNAIRKNIYIQDLL